MRGALVDQRQPVVSEHGRTLRQRGFKGLDGAIGLPQAHQRHPELGMGLGPEIAPADGIKGLVGRLSRLAPLGMDKRQAKGGQSRLRLELPDRSENPFGLVEPFGGEMGPADVAEEVAA